MLQSPIVMTSEDYGLEEDLDDSEPEASGNDEENVESVEILPTPTNETEVGAEPHQPASGAAPALTSVLEKPSKSVNNTGKSARTVRKRSPKLDQALDVWLASFHTIFPKTKRALEDLCHKAYEILQSECVMVRAGEHIVLWHLWFDTGIRHQGRNELHIT